jgi:hypothetical protein
MSEQIMKSTQVKSPANQAKPIMHDKALRHLADSIYKQLQSEGCHPKDIIGVSSQLLSLVTTELGEKKLPS